MKEISLHILDIFQNSVRAGSKNVELEVKESRRQNILSIRIKDDGKGIQADMLKTVDDPWTTSRTKRNIGLGIPLLKQHAEAAGGSLRITSEENHGTEIEVIFQLDHIDRQPIGDLTGVLKLMMCTDGGVEVLYRHVTDEGSYEFSSLEVKEVLNIKDLNDRGLLNDIEGMIRENLTEIRAELI